MNTALWYPARETSAGSGSSGVLGLGTCGLSRRMPCVSGGTPLTSDVMAGQVQLGETVRAAMVDAPLSARARMFDRSNAPMASGRNPSRTTMITRRIAVGMDILVLQGMR